LHVPVHLIRSALATLLLAACGSTPPPGMDAGPVDAPPVVPTIEIGTGDPEFVAIAEGQDLEVIRGPQNGFHFLASVRVSGVEAGNPDDRMDPRNPTTEFRVFRDMDRVDLMASSYTQGLDPIVGGGGHEMVGRFLILDIASDDVLDGVMVRMEVTFTDVDGVVLEDQRNVRAIPHPANM